MAQIKGIHSFSGYNGGSFATKTYRTSLFSELLPLFRLFKQYSLCDETFHMRQASQSEPADCGNVQGTCESDRKIPFHRSRQMQKKTIAVDNLSSVQMRKRRLFVIKSSCYRSASRNHLMKDD